MYVLWYAKHVKQTFLLFKDMTKNLIAKMTFKNVHVMRYNETCVRYKMQVEQVMSPINVPKESFDGHVMSSYH